MNVKGLLLCLCCALLGQCAPYRAAAAADNSIMLVLSRPPSLGFKRLQYHRAQHPDLHDFVTQVGQPDCLAETTQGDRHYMILYYLDARKAFSFRHSTRSNGAPMQMSGPYPISDKEFELLSGMKTKAYASLEGR